MIVHRIICHKLRDPGITVVGVNLLLEFFFCKVTFNNWYASGSDSRTIIIYHEPITSKLIQTNELHR